MFSFVRKLNRIPRTHFRNYTQKQNIDLVVNAQWVAPVVPQGLVLKRHSIAVYNSKILEVLPTEVAEKKYSAKEVVDKKNHLIIPGLINTHTHSPMTLFRGYADDLSLFSWLEEYILPAERHWISPKFVRDGSKLAIAEMIKSGTTCFTDMYFFPNETVEEALSVGIRTLVGITITKFPTAHAKTSEEYFKLAEESFEKYKNETLVNVCLAPHAPYSVSDEQFKKINQLAEKYDAKVTCHIHETEREVKESLNKFGMRPIERLHRLGFINNRLLAVHCTNLTPEEINLFSMAGTSVVNCPESNCKLASGISPVPSLVSAGVNVALGTDSCASNNELDLFGEMKLSAMLGKVISKDPKVISATEALSMATINGAKAMGWDNKIGSLENGKYADMVAVDLASLFTVPFYNPISLLVYSAGRDRVSDVWIAGKRQLKEGKLVSYDEEKLYELAHKWGKDIANHSEFWKNSYPL